MDPQKKIGLKHLSTRELQENTDMVEYIPESVAHIVVVSRNGVIVRQSQDNLYKRNIDWWDNKQIDYLA